MAMTENELIIDVAQAQGWTNIQRVEGYLMGSPARRPHARTNLPAYLTDANEWVKLLEEMKDSGDCRPMVRPYAKGGWACVLAGGIVYKTVHHPSLGGAVCLAWLAWKGAKGNG